MAEGRSEPQLEAATKALASGHYAGRSDEENGAAAREAAASAEPEPGLVRGLVAAPFAFVRAAAAIVVRLVVVLFIVQAVQWFSDPPEVDASDGPSGKYNQTRCQVLRIMATGDGEDSLSLEAAGEYDLHC